MLKTDPASGGQAEARSAADLLLVEDRRRVEDRLLEADRLAAGLLREAGQREAGPQVVVRPVESRAAPDLPDRSSCDSANKTPSGQGGVFLLGFLCWGFFVDGISIRRDACVRSFQLRLELGERDGLRNVIVEAGLDRALLIALHRKRGERHHA